MELQAVRLTPHKPNLTGLEKTLPPDEVGGGGGEGFD